MQKIKTEHPCPYRLSEMIPITRDTSAFRFQLPSETTLDFLPGDHMLLHLEKDGETITRPYTPSSTPDDVGFFELIVKRYPTGIASKYLHQRKPNDQVLFSGPFPGGHFQEGMAKRIGMLAGGAGVTPMIAIIRTVLRRGYDVDIALLFANKTVDDIILRDELEGYSRVHPRFRCLFALDDPPPDWQGHRGLIHEQVMRAFLPEPSQDTLIFLCGPPMMEHQLRQALLHIGHDKNHVVIP